MGTSSSKPRNKTTNTKIKPSRKPKNKSSSKSIQPHYQPHRNRHSIKTANNSLYRLSKMDMLAGLMTRRDHIIEISVRICDRYSLWLEKFATISKRIHYYKCQHPKSNEVERDANSVKIIITNLINVCEDCVQIRDNLERYVMKTFHKTRLYQVDNILMCAHEKILAHILFDAHSARLQFVSPLKIINDLVEKYTEIITVSDIDSDDVLINLQEQNGYYLPKYNDIIIF